MVIKRFIHKVVVGSFYASDPREKSGPALIITLRHTQEIAPPVTLSLSQEELDELTAWLTSFQQSVTKGEE